MDTNTELKNHLLFEFRDNQPLVETRSVVDGIDDVVNIFASMVEAQATKLFASQATDICDEQYDSHNTIWLQNHPKTFFNDFKLNITFFKKSTIACSGGVNSDCIHVDGDGAIMAIPKIHLKIGAPSLIVAMKVFMSSIGHELTHAYNQLQYSIKNSDTQNIKYGSDSVLLKNKYLNIRNANLKGTTKNMQAIGHILYLLSRVERNAFIGQLRQELLSRKDEIVDNKTAFEAIKSTDSYQKFLNLETNINIINTPNALTDLTKDQLIQYLNNIMDLNLTNFNQVRKYFTRRWEKWKKAYLIKASKIGYDIYSENNQMFDGMPMKTYPIFQN